MIAEELKTIVDTSQGIAEDYVADRKIAGLLS